jgi:hypothetical protein
MYYEHKEKDYEKAREVVMEGLALAGEASRSQQEDFSRRLERLGKKIERQKKRKVPR